MNFLDIQFGTSVFVDANVIVYAYAQDPVFGAACTDLLERIELGQLQGVMSSHGMSDVSHRLMTLDACRTLGWPYAGVTRRLRRHPDEIQKLQQFRQALDDIVAIGVRILPVHVRDVLSAGDISIQDGLLSGDALMVAVMRANGLTQIASNDTDFDRVPGITRFAPI